MFKAMCYFAMMVAMLALSGCPDQAPVAPVVPDVVQATEEVVAVTEVMPITGGFRLDIDLGINAEKGYGPLDIINKLKLMATIVEVGLFKVDGDRLYKTFSAEVVDGQASCLCSEILGGDYWIEISVRDAETYLLFYGGGVVTVRNGITTEVMVAIKPLKVYSFNFVVPGFTGTYESYTTVREANGRESEIWCRYIDGQMCFTGVFPLDFTGGEMIAKDVYGMPYAIPIPPIPAMTDWSNFQFSDVMVLDTTGDLNVNVQIDVSDYTNLVDENGKKLPTLKVFTTAVGTSFVFSEGDYVCIDGGWYKEPHYCQYFDTSYIVRYLIDGEWKEIAIGFDQKVEVQGRPTEVMMTFIGHYRGERGYVYYDEISFNNDIFVVMYNGAEMTYQDRSWIIPA